MVTEFAIAEVTPGRLNALVKNIMQQTGATDPNEAVRLVNSGEWIVSKLVRQWRVGEDGVIYFSVTSDGTLGEKWIGRLEDKGVGSYAKRLLLSPDFKPTSGVTYEVAVLPGSLFEDSDRITSKIRAIAYERKLTKPNAELACLIREKFTNQEIEAMGLWGIVAMHEPIKASDGDPCLLTANRSGSDGLGAYCGKPDKRWSRDGGFAFVVSQVSPQN